MSSEEAGSPSAERSKSEKPESAAPPLWAHIDAMPSLSPMPGVTMWPLAGSNLMINFVRIEPDAAVPLHHHAHEQGGTVLEGTLILTIDGETRELGKGDAYIAGSHALHGARSGPEGCLVVDVFAPPREDYILPPR